MKDLYSVDWTFKEARTEPLHSIHPYPAKFIPQIPEKLLELFSPKKNLCILDPFCGSGVTVCVAQKMGYNAIGVDLNPIATLITRVKTTPVADDFLNICDSIVEECKKHEQPVEKKNFPNIDHWFSVDIQYALAILKEQIDVFRDYQNYDALNFCFSSIIVKVSNQDSDTRYAFRDKGKTKTDVLKFFLQSARKLKKNSIKDGTTATILNMNSLHLDDQIPNNIGAVITSPPYPCAYEYWLYHKFRMYWLNYDPIQVRGEEIGARYSYFKKSKYEGYDFAVQMTKLLSYLYDKCVPGAPLCFVIGRSKIHGQIYNNDEIIADIGKSIGYKYIATLTRDMVNSRKSFNLSHARIKVEYIVVLQK
ncbi:DNA methyltransferase [Xylanibacter muris]|uniref:RNA methyltransferase n=1 Tax=Xylanibacter muris TaxID=2736290 RepID=A0ABX2AME1_9BACT|nr:DNA methyltransferase [Xylanibacter muris]NPD92401.1 RNA methyltransferase [Xylanibacter muris]